MSVIDFILNIAGLLLWLNWRSIRFDPLAKRLPATLMGTLRPAAPQRLKRWHFLLFIGALLFLRAVIYWWIGSAANWTARLDFGPVVLSCRSDWFLRILVFSFFSFGLTLGIFYLCLLPLSLLAGPEPMHRLVKIPLGRVDDWPRWAKIIIPFFATAACWWLASWVFAWVQIAPPVSMAARSEQSIVIGLGSYLVWKYPLCALLVLHLVSSYVYFGKHPFWKYVAATSQKILSPLKKVPLRFGKVDFAPIAGVVVIFLVAEGIGYELWRLFTKLPL
jgi:uncharacterized protein YggT (Ycf19 family)